MQCSPMKLSQALATAFIFSFATSSLAAETPRLQFTNGDVQIQDANGNLRPAIKGDFVLPGEKIITGDGGMAQLRVFNQGVVALKAKSEITIEPPVRELFSVKIDRGLIRTVTKLAEKVGKIDVITPGASIAVDTGDVLTGVNLEKQDNTTHNQVLDGRNIQIKTGVKTELASVGKILEISPTDGGIIKEIIEKPDAMNLRVAEPTLEVTVKLPESDILSKPLIEPEKTTFDSDITKIASIDPDRIIVTEPIETIEPIKTFEPIIEETKLVTEPVLVNPIENVKVVEVDSTLKSTFDGATYLLVEEDIKTGDVRFTTIEEPKLSTTQLNELTRETEILKTTTFDTTKVETFDDTKVLDTKQLETTSQDTFKLDSNLTKTFTKSLF